VEANPVIFAGLIAMLAVNYSPFETPRDPDFLNHLGSERDRESRSDPLLFDLTGTRSRGTLRGEENVPSTGEATLRFAGNEVDVARAAAQATNDEGARVLDVTGVKVFSATKAKERELLGEVITDWMRTNQDRVEVVDKIVTQSSDAEFHCLTITLFYKHKA
jgi:hypothetical protein